MSADIAVRMPHDRHDQASGGTGKIPKVGHSALDAFSRGHQTLHAQRDIRSDSNTSRSTEKFSAASRPFGGLRKVTPAIHKADELIGFTGHLGEIDNIFFGSSARRGFSSSEERESFRERWLGRYIANHRESFFVALDGSGRVVGYLAGCLKNPTELVHFSDIEYFKTIGDICRDYPAHLHINVAPRWRNHGLGAALIERFALWARLHSVEGIHLVTSSTSRSIPFYQRSGFREVRMFPWNSGVSVCMGRKL